MQKGFVIGVFVTLIILLSVGGAYYLGTQNKSSQEQPATSTTTKTIVSPTQIVQTPTPTEVVKKLDVPEDWLTYENEEYGFEISYPPSYKALDDEENLYGWPDAIVLIYKGGQSYDLPIEVWDTKAKYEAKYPNAENLTVKQVGSKFITFLNMNLEPEVDEIIETFELTQ